MNIQRKTWILTLSLTLLATLLLSITRAFKLFFTNINFSTYTLKKIRFIKENDQNSTSNNWTNLTLLKRVWQYVNGRCRSCCVRFLPVQKQDSAAILCCFPPLTWWGGGLAHRNFRIARDCWEVSPVNETWLNGQSVCIDLFKLKIKVYSRIIQAADIEQQTGNWKSVYWSEGEVEECLVCMM